MLEEYSWADALEDALGAGSLHAHSDAGILRLEGLAEAFRELQVHRRVERNLAFFFRRLDQGRRHRFRRRRCGDPHGEGAEAKRPSTFEHIAFRKPFGHGVPVFSPAHARAEG